MADKDLHISNKTVHESGADQLHLASSVGVTRGATFTEDNAVRVPSEYYYLSSSGTSAYDV